jgi:hypothetical protein
LESIHSACSSPQITHDILLHSTTCVLFIYLSIYIYIYYFKLINRNQRPGGRDRDGLGMALKATIKSLGHDY